MVSFLGSFIGSSCVLCGSHVQREISLCHACEADLPRIEHACQQCGIPLEASSLICGQCLKSPPAFDYSLSLYHYETPIDYLISELKFNKKLAYAEILGFLLKTKLSLHQENDRPDAIIPVPLHTKRLVKRGFNQSHEIAKVVAKSNNIPIDYRLITRHKATRAQSELDVVQRKKNIKGCFQLNHHKNPKEMMPAYSHVVIIDDVVTTGATSNELATILKQSGIKKVGVWSLARAILHGSPAPIPSTIDKA